MRNGQSHNTGTAHFICANNPVDGPYHLYITFVLPPYHPIFHITSISPPRHLHITSVSLPLSPPWFMVPLRIAIRRFFSFGGTIMNFDDKVFGERIRNLRQIMGISMEEMADRLLVSENYLGKVERGIRRPSFEFVMQFAATVDVTVDFLLMNRNIKRPLNETALSLAEQLQTFVDQNSRKEDNLSLNGTTSP